MILVKDFDDIFGDTDIDHVLDILVGYGVVHLIDGYVIIELNSGCLPDGPFEMPGRQR